ncbi:MAG: hypothetical protein ACKVY0_25760 [Prosthecobacter sp.]|uniref:hypothetical protein n=1 Tax=Prosthecobacter sp. TaxID=1965333 RepID=UPI003901755E
MKTPFLQPHFEGERFDAHTLPVEVARDLAAYEELVMELAKHLYLQKHEGRKRVPRGFEKQFSLHIERVDEGSAKPLLSWVAAAGLLIPGGAESEYFEGARDVIAECVQASAEGRVLPAAFPPHLLDYFNVLGRSLREGESVNLADSNRVPAILTPERRKKLVLAVQKTYQREVEMAGVIEETDWKNQTFRLRLDDGTAATAPFSAFYDPLVRQAGGITRTRVLLRGVGVFDAYDKLQKVAQTEHLEASENHALAAQFEVLAGLKDGWMDGTGAQPPKEPLAQLADRLVSSFPADLPFPFVCATTEGHVFLEWTGKDHTASAEVSLSEEIVELQATHLGTGETVDEDAKLNTAQSVGVIYNFVRRFV